MLDEVNTIQLVTESVAEPCDQPKFLWTITNVIVILLSVLKITTIVWPVITPRRLWPPNIIQAVLSRCTVADAEIRGVTSTRTTSGIIARVMDLQENAKEFCQHHDRTLHSGVLPYVRSWKRLYSEASALEAEMDDIEAIPEVQDLLRHRSATKNRPAWMTSDLATTTNATMINLSQLSPA
ncbi:hypothetical protein BDZ89DRAFT_1085621 [Hymenopellis radicata]|nr:hypothetical protein BDZ89DRAFT_1085621 [Hymenopellis radicata]